MSEIDELRAALEAFRVEMGHSHATADYWVKPGLGQSMVFVYPRGSGERENIICYGEWRDALDEARAIFAGRYANRATEATKALALAIIRLTFEHGECTDAALRADFDSSDVDRYAEAACVMASEMGEKGPFSIVRTSGANDQ